MLLSVALQNPLLAWLDWCMASAAAMLVTLLLAVCIELLRTRRWRTVFLWPVLLTPFAAILTSIYYAGSVVAF